MKRRWMLSAVLLLSGCTSMSNTEQGATTGGILGGLGGLVVGSIFHRPLAGAAIGAAAGATTGAIGGNQQDRAEDRAVRQASAVAAQSALSLEQIVDMVQKHISDQIIINQIRQSSTAFNLTADQITWLKSQGVSDAVVMEMQAHSPQVMYTRPATTVIYSRPVGYYGYGR